MSEPNEIARLLAAADQITDLSFQRQLYEDLHERPELSGQEVETHRLLLQHLERFDCEVVAPIGGFGICAIFRNGNGPTALFRADMDALPVKEETGVPFASTRMRPRPDGTMAGTMHACGHDMHMTSLMGICAIMDSHRESWAGTFIALFQPSEENSLGANAMIHDGLVSRIPRPDVCFGQHVMPGPAGEVQTMPGAQFAACDSIRITMHGNSAHGSMPHRAIDPTIIAAMVVVRLQTIVGREVDPDDFAVVSVGSLHAGNTNNIIPDKAELILNCRSFSNATKRRLYASIQRVVVAECQASNSPKPPEFEFFAHGELIDNSPEVYATVRPTFDRVFGIDSVRAHRTSVSEDFANIPNAFSAPYMFWAVGCTPREVWDEAVEKGTVDTDVPVNHQSNFLPDYEPTVKATTQAGTAAVLTYLGI